MSPRAAWRLHGLGYDAYDYVAGKADWLAFGLPYEGAALLAGSAITTAVPTCGVADRVGDVRSALAASRLGLLAVLNAEGVVLGRLDRDALAEDDDVPVDRVMAEGPTTVRPSEELSSLTSRMRRVDVDAVLVTSSDGRLLGLFERSRGEETIKEPT